MFQGKLGGLMVVVINYEMDDLGCVLLMEGMDEHG